MTVAAAVSWGNRCGHDPLSPRFFSPAPEYADVRWPRFLLRARERLQDFYRHADLLPTLAERPGYVRMMRSERREGVSALLGALVQSCDLCSLRVGRPVRDTAADAPDGFAGIPLAELGARAGLTMRRAERASHDIVAAGILTVHPRAVPNADGELRGLAAMRQLSKAFFMALGLGAELREAQSRAYKRAKRREHKDAGEPTPAHGRGDLAIAAAKRALDAGEVTGRGYYERVRAAMHGAGPSKDPPDRR